MSGGSVQRADGPWPFVTRRSYSLGKRHVLWRARRDRKGLGAARPPIWQSPAYNWSIGAIFALGAFLFMLGSVLSLLPPGLAVLPEKSVNLVFFLGSVPFTTAACLQHFQAANAPGFGPGQPAPRRVALIGWHPGQAGWLATFSQLLGTLAFNASTLNAVFARPLWYVEDSAIWLPDIAGSILFLISGYLAFIEVGHRYWSWHPRDLDWRIVFVNLLGCIAFMTAGILSSVPRGGESSVIQTLSTLHTLAGAACFFIGALLLCRESAVTAN